MPAETIALHAPEHIPNVCIDCRAPLMPRVHVWSNADRDEWVCSEQCGNGLYFDWSEDHMREMGLTPDAR